MTTWRAIGLRGLAVVVPAAGSASDEGVVGRRAALYVANALDDSVARLDRQSGHQIGPALPA